MNEKTLEYYIASKIKIIKVKFRIRGELLRNAIMRTVRRKTTQQ